MLLVARHVAGHHVEREQAASEANIRVDDFQAKSGYMRTYPVDNSGSNSLSGPAHKSHLFRGAILIAVGMLFSLPR